MTIFSNYYYVDTYFVSYENLNFFLPRLLSIFPRHLLKQVARAMSGGTLTRSVAFLGQNLDSVPQLDSSEDCRNVHLVLKLYQKMAKRFVAPCVRGKKES